MSQYIFTQLFIFQQHQSCANERLLSCSLRSFNTNVKIVKVKPLYNHVGGISRVGIILVDRDFEA